MTLKIPFKYRDYYYDEETGLYYLNARYYNPEWGRFINADSYGGSIGQLLSHNLFAYCSNNPVMRVDPSGHDWFVDLFKAVVDTVQTIQKVVEVVATVVAVAAVAVAVVAVVTTVVAGTGGLALVGGGIMLGAATISTEAALVAGTAGCIYLAKKGYDSRNSSKNSNSKTKTSKLSDAEKKNDIPSWFNKNMVRGCEDLKSAGKELTRIFNEKIWYWKLENWSWFRI